MEKKGSKPNKNYYRPLAVAFAAFILVFFIAGLILPDKEMSAKEKRMLSRFPEMSSDRVLSGGFADDFEEYASDQIPFRDAFTGLKVRVDLAAGKKESEGVYLCRDGSLIERMEEPDEEKVDNTLAAMTDFAGRINADPLLVLVPNAVSVYKEKLPALAVTADQKAFSETVQQKLAGAGVEYLDLTGTLLAGKESVDLYYKTDHHWTTPAAKLCAPVVLNALERSFTDDYTPLVACCDFKGSLAAKSALAGDAEDEIIVYAPEEDPVCLVTGSGGAGKRATVYSEEGLESSDPYTVFLGGNEGLIQIETDRIGSGKLLVFKDSYFNCFLPFLLRSYEQIDVVDPRYFSGDLNTLLLNTEYDQVLFFYNMNTFSEDTSLSLVLNEITGGEEG